MAWYSHLFKNFLRFFVIHTVKGFSVVNESVDVFLEFSCFFYDIDVSNLTSGPSAFLTSSLYFWRCLAHALLKTSLKNFEHYLAKV